MQRCRYLTAEEIVELHIAANERYGGLGGLRDSSALDSCVAQPQTIVFGTERFPSLPEKAAAYCFFIIVTHPFIDGNKRTAFLAGLHFLLVNGVQVVIDSTSAEAAILAVANGECREVADLVSVFEGMRATRG